MLVTWGLARPTVILPEAARAWSDDRLRVVLSHELAHVRRGDWGTQLAAELLRAVQWFNPVAWMVCRRLRRESEHACDDAVLNAGVAGPAYATHLLDLARAYSVSRGAWSPALPVARPSGLERRVRAMLDAHLNRRPVTRGTRLATALLFLVLAGAVAGVAVFAQGPFATVAGSISDSMRGALPNATLTMTNSGTKAKNEVRSDSSGRYEFVGLPPGDYVLEASVPGFRNYRSAVAVNGQQLDRDIVMDVATLQETITVTDDDTPPRVMTVEEIAGGRAAASQEGRQRGVRPAAGPGSARRRACWREHSAAGEASRRPAGVPAALKAAKVGGTGQHRSAHRHRWHRCRDARGSLRASRPGSRRNGCRARVAVRRDAVELRAHRGVDERERELPAAPVRQLVAAGGRRLRCRTSLPDPPDLPAPALTR